MNEVDRQKIEQIISDRNRAHAFYSKRLRVYRSFIEMEKTAYATGKLGRMEKELIAVGISVVLNCESCMEWHIKMAFDNGADIDQVLEAIGVGIEMGGGPATVASRFAMKILDYYGGEN
jgi:AhpD family alkylhydroperoxidase